MVKPAASRAAATVEDIPRFTIVDAAMTLLAVASVTLVLFDILARKKLYAWGLFTTVVALDALITLVFILDFVGKARGSPSLARAFRDNWFDALGLIPMGAFVALEAGIAGVPVQSALLAQVSLSGGAGAGGFLRLFRFVRIVRVFSALSRFLRATNMTFGEAVTKTVFDRYRRIILAELTTPILLAGITVSQEVVIRMKFLESVGKALDAKRPEIHAAVVEALKNNRVPDNLLAAPIVERIVNDVERSVVDTIVDTLTGPELNNLTQKMIVEVLENFKLQLASPEGRAMLKAMGEEPSKSVAVKAVPGAR